MAAGVIIIQNGRVLVVRENQEDFFSFPGGTCRRGESFEHTAIREVKEELSLNISLKGDPYIYEFERYIGNDVEMVVLFNFQIESVRNNLKLNSDAKELKWKSLREDFSDCFPNVEPTSRFFINRYGPIPDYQIKQTQ